MFKRIFTLMLAISLALILAWPVLAQEESTPTAKALEFLKTKLNDDGGFSTGFAPESDITTTADVIVATALADQDPETTFIAGENTPVSFLEAQVAAGKVAGAGQLAKVLNAAVAAGADVRDFGGQRLIDDLLNTQQQGGMFGTGAFDHCLALIALQNAAVDLPDGALDALIGAQNDDGGWGFMAGQASDTNTTGLCLQALAPTGAADATKAGLAYLKAIQNEDSGWPYQNPSDYGTDSDTNSTALVVQALVANGEDLAEWNDPQEWLLSMQLENGAFSFQEAAPGESILATVGAIPALEEKPLNAWALDVVGE
ncbi:MAG TPA: prenyltransferase/squalene oxidase repeat-containing protein [Aggregatilineaceae bacterium]|nr:prenyltransferase/squalene oxidase repeat-containing protein [Aggregatilineaceae bacterium]